MNLREELEKIDLFDDFGRPIDKDFITKKIERARQELIKQTCLENKENCKCVHCQIINEVLGEK